MGVEYLRWHDTGSWQLLSRGEYIFLSAPPDLARRFPVWDDPTTWDLSGLDARVQRFDQNFGDWTIDIPRPSLALWVGDTWKINNALTLNGGVRWDADFGALDPPHITTQVTFNPAAGAVYPDTALEPGDRLYPGGLRDLNNIAPRGGFTWNLGGAGTTVVRGGSGLYFSIPDSNTTFSHQSFNGERILVNSFNNDGLPGFLADPTRGRTADDFLSGRFPIPPQSPRVIASDYKMPYTWQSSIGFQTQFGPRLGFEADLTHWKGYNFARQRDPNLFFNPATGYNLNPNVARPNPKFTRIQWLESTGKADSSSLQTGINKRYADNWQASLTYTYMFFFNDNTTNFQYQGQQPLRPGCRVGAVNRVPAPHPAPERLVARALGHQRVGRVLLRLGQLLRHHHRGQSVRAHRHEPLRHGPGDRASRPAGPLRRPGLVCHRRRGPAQRAQGHRPPPRRHAAVQGHPAARGDERHRHRRSVQRLQPQELRRIPERAQPGRVRPAAPEPAQRLSAAHRAAGVPRQLSDGPVAPALGRDSRGPGRPTGPVACTASVRRGPR